MKILPRSFYERPTLEVAKELLGKVLVHQGNSCKISGKIVEVEAYIGENDPACHAAFGPTPRNQIMYGPGGFSYVYFIYGMYHCLNFVTEKKGSPAAVLIRALEPVEGIGMMRKNRQVGNLHQLTNGPGKLCKALAISRTQNKYDLTNSDLYVIDSFEKAKHIISSTRIGIRVGTDKKWRFYIDQNPYVSHSINRKK